MIPSATQVKRLNDDGFVVLNDFMPDVLLVALRNRVNQLFDQEGDAAGSEFKQETGCRRLANLVDKGAIFQSVIAMPDILECVRLVLGSEIKLSSLNARQVVPDGAGMQPFHADMGAVADEKGFWVCNTVWMLDDFTPENGAIRAIPGSHRWGKLPQDVLADPTADDPRQVLVTGRAGSVVIMNAHLWHAGTANHTDKTRTAVHAFYCRYDKPQQQYQKSLVRAAVQNGLTPELRCLLALDDPLNDRLSADVCVRSGFLK